ncbi:multifunctional CCA addition/repair protein [Endozoicomonas numazuensis]|uniref:CCA-adding enzyme n=1 Tax=Endozoicomonas numazuensis TaxID=1137799 RepID=A0A081NEU1_9GAMM|nr:multifunctional CCA addition/repair protein [Endozoicomonas numazuensis]KEQ16964.1 hypothetical protein GZ78_20275 [Endozoicomonas numazuensis]
MNIFLVGGAVRDKLLNLPVKDHDWVVVGSSPQQMIDQGFQPVGQDFPVFLHPETKEEYALARTERKSGHGYNGFVFHTAPDVTLEEDLIRRDLTINAIAEDEQGNIHDPYNGQTDLKQKLLRHVSPAFQEDPLRILRVARFAARFHHLGFSVAPETMKLMRSMVDSGEASYLVAERVWQETSRALCEPNPEIFFKVLSACNAMSVVMPEWTPFLKKDSTGMKSLQVAASRQESPEVRFAATFANELELNQEMIKALVKRLKTPSQFSEMANLTFQYSGDLIEHSADREPERWMTLFEKTDAFRRTERFEAFLKACSCIAEAQEKPLPKNRQEMLKALLALCLSMNAKEIVAQGFKGKAVGEQLRKTRVLRMQEQLSQ